jgi:hypothetical protein
MLKILKRGVSQELRAKELPEKVNEAKVVIAAHHQRGTAGSISAKERVGRLRFVVVCKTNLL